MQKSAKLNNSQKIHIKPFDPINLSLIKRTIPDNELNKFEKLLSSDTYFQCRRISHLSLYCNQFQNSNDNFIYSIKKKTSYLYQKSRNPFITIHICANLSENCGNGFLIETIRQIHENINNFKILLYLYIPRPNHTNDESVTHCYATLAELNAIGVGSFNPVSLPQIDKLNTNNSVNKSINFTIAYTFLFSETSKTNFSFSVSNYIYQKFIAEYHFNPLLCRYTEEPIFTIPEFDQCNRPIHSVKFGTIGIMSIAYPEAEIEEFVTYNFARQAARQLQFNLWQEGIGYAETSLEEVGSGFASEIKDRKNHERLMLSNNYLMLSKPIIESAGTKRWHDIDTTWEEYIMETSEYINTQINRNNWLAIFSDACTDYFEKDFRALGVKKFYETQRGERSAYAKAIRRHIETLLFNEWQSGQKSILEIEKYTSLLIADCTERISDIKEQIAKMEEELDECNERIRQCNIEWDNIGWLRDAITGASKKVFSAYKTAKCELYTTATRIEAYRFATELMQAVIEQLGLMKDGVVQYKSILAAILEEVARQADSKCKKDEDADETGIQKKYDPDMVQRFTKACVVNKETQSDNALSIRNKLVKALGEDGERSFANLCDRTDYETAGDIILDVCQTTARAAMENAAQADPLNKMLGVNILEKLKQEYNTEDKLEQLVRSMINSAKPYLQFNAEEQAKNFPGGGNMMQMVQLCIPKFDDDNSGFRDKLINTFVQIYPDLNPKEDVSINYKNNQIVVVAAASGFPLRYVSNVKVLKKRYEDMLASPESDLNKMVLHTETFAKPLPSLFEMDILEIKEMVTPYVMKAYAFNLFVEKSDPTTGAHFDAINLPDEFGDDNWVRAGKDLMSTIDVLANDYNMAQKVMALVDKNMKTQCRTNDQKVAMRKALVAVLKEKILPSAACENNEFSSAYARYKAIARDIMEYELKE